MPLAAQDAAGVADAGAPPWPAWLEAARLDDSLAAAAYEATPARFRAALKTGLALAHFHFGESPTRRDGARASGRLGFCEAALCSPAPWALIVLDPAYAAAARLTAACAAALLAGVPEVAALSPGAVPPPAALVSLELSGVEDIFSLDAARVGALLDELAALPGPRGRVVILHDGQLGGMARGIRARGLPCYEERRPPRLRIEEGAPIDRALLAFAHGGTAALEAALTATGPADAVYSPGGEALAPAPDAPLTLTAGCEGFWLYPGLDPDFFTVSRLALAPWAPAPAHPQAS